MAIKLEDVNKLGQAVWVFYHRLNEAKEPERLDLWNTVKKAYEKVNEQVSET